MRWVVHSMVLLFRAVCAQERMPRMHTARVTCICPWANTALKVHHQALSSRRSHQPFIAWQAAEWGICALKSQLNTGASCTWAKCPVCRRPKIHLFLNSSKSRNFFLCVPLARFSFTSLPCRYNRKWEEILPMEMWLLETVVTRTSVPIERFPIRSCSGDMSNFYIFLSLLSHWESLFFTYCGLDSPSLLFCYLFNRQEVDFFFYLLLCQHLSQEVKKNLPNMDTDRNKKLTEVLNFSHSKTNKKFWLKLKHI